jgi:ribosomal protein L14
MLNRSYRTVTAERLAVEMGDAFVVALRGVPEARWSGPVVSAFGVHAVKLVARDAGGDVAFDDVAPARGPRLANVPAKRGARHGDG